MLCLQTCFSLWSSCVNSFFCTFSNTIRTFADRWIIWIDIRQPGHDVFLVFFSNLDNGRSPSFLFLLLFYLNSPISIYPYSRCNLFYVCVLFIILILIFFLFLFRGLNVLRRLKVSLSYFLSYCMPIFIFYLALSISQKTSIFVWFVFRKYIW